MIEFYANSSSTNIFVIYYITGMLMVNEKEYPSLLVKRPGYSGRGSNV